MIFMALSDTQNFINNKELVDKLIGFVNFDGISTVIEIGPGRGIIADSLIGKIRDFIAVEYDKKLFLELEKRYKNQNIKLVNEDFLKFILPDSPFIVVANIPFNITADIIKKLINSKMKSAYLIMQKEAGVKYLGAPSAQSPLLSHFIKIKFEIRKLLDIDRKNYTPNPISRTSIFRVT